MSRDSEEEPEILENVAEVIEGLKKELEELYQFRDMFFENHPMELAADKNGLVDKKKGVLVEKFESIDEKQIPLAQRAQFLYMKGRCYNVNPTYEPNATQYLSKAVKLNPHLIEAWNELGECYWKNMNVKEAQASFEGALKQERNRVSLRCLSIVERQVNVDKRHKEACEAVLKSVDLAKEAVALDTKDGISWSVLGNAYLCQFFTVAQDPATLKAAMSAYKQAWNDPVARGQPDLYYNKAIAFKYEECYIEAMENFEFTQRLDPLWNPPKEELASLKQYLTRTDEIVRTHGKIKPKKLSQMIQSLDKKKLGVYGEGNAQPVGSRCDSTLELVTLDGLQEGMNQGKVILGRVIGSIPTESAVPFTFAVTDASMACMSVTVYNWAHGRGAIIGDCVCIPEPTVTRHQCDSPDLKYDFKTIRVNNPLQMLLNGRRINKNQFARTKVCSTYEIH